MGCFEAFWGLWGGGGAEAGGRIKLDNAKLNYIKFLTRIKR
jgi:hypothetical protein